MAGKVDGGKILTILVAIIFVFIGIQGFTGDTDSAIYHVFDTKGDAMDIIIGIVVVAAGALLVLPTFVPAIPSKVVDISKFVVLIVWLVIIVFGDVFPLLDGKVKFVDWLVGFTQNLLVLYCIFQVTGNPVKKGK